MVVHLLFVRPCFYCIVKRGEMGKTNGKIGKKMETVTNTTSPHGAAKMK
jgi:hypothetical protein